MLAFHNRRHMHPISAHVPRSPPLDDSKTHKTIIHKDFRLFTKCPNMTPLGLGIADFSTHDQLYPQNLEGCTGVA